MLDRARVVLALLFFLFMLPFTVNTGQYNYEISDWGPNISIKDPELAMFFNRIMTTFIEEGIVVNLEQPIRIYFDEEYKETLPYGVLGVAKGMFNPRRVQIVFSKSKWVEMTTVEKYWTMMHEMGHDFFFIYHHGDGIMRQYHRRGENRRTLTLAANEFIQEIKRLQRYEFRGPMISQSI